MNDTFTNSLDKKTQNNGSVMLLQLPSKLHTLIATMKLEVLNGSFTLAKFVSETVGDSDIHVTVIALATDTLDGVT
jgi:hypothetical protein